MSDHDESGADEQLIDRSTATFRFIPTIKFSKGNDPEPTCVVTINVKKTATYYYISYEYNYENTRADIKTSIQHPAHPFRKNIIPIDSRHDIHNGTEVIINEVTEAMVSYLMMDDDELCKYTGNITPMRYRNDIMISLGMLCN